MGGRSGKFGSKPAVDPLSFQARFGDLVRGVRLRNGLRLKDVARLVYNDETKASRVSDVESGRNEPTADTISLYCAALEIPVEQVERLRRGSKLRWPIVQSPGVKSDRNIIGRKPNVEALHRTLLQHRAAAVVPSAVLKGQGGIGKTAIARYYLEVYGHYYFGVWWIAAQYRESVIDGLCELAVILDVEQESSKRLDIAKATLVKLSQQEDPWVLVFDNAESIEHLRHLFPDHGPLSLLVTSRTSAWPERFHTLEADLLSAPDALRLLIQESKRSWELDEAEQLISALGGLPLAIVAAGAWLKNSPSTSLTDYLTRLEKMIRKKPRELLDYPDSVFGTTMLSVDRLSEPARHLLRLLSFLSPEGVAVSTLTRLPEELAPGLERDEAYLSALGAVSKTTIDLLSNLSSIEQAFSELESTSLVVRRADESYSVHRLTQLVVRSSLGESIERLAYDAAAIVAAAYPSHSRNPEFQENWASCSALEGHVVSLAEYCGEIEPLEILLKQSCRYLDAQGEYTMALEYARRVLNSRERRLPADDLEIAGSVNDLAIQVWRELGPQEAEPYAARAAEIALQKTNYPDERRAKWLSIHGVVLGHVAEKDSKEKKKETLAKARKRHLQALRLDLKSQGKRSRTVGLRLFNIAYVRLLQENYPAAVRLFGASLSTKSSVSEHDDPDVAFGLQGLGMALTQGGFVQTKYKGRTAKDLLTESLEIRRAAFESKPRHPLIIKSALWLAICNKVLVRLFDRSGSLEQCDALLEEFRIDRSELDRQAADCYHRARNEAL
ncbi:helix-turn-helix domain-containing protein [Ruegeria arenilitoris]|uniref:DUF7779 domain-containing protein n=1 Tax=Ruegeria arenilitoris TaxID=1173585 RepID=UPI002467CFEB|nr:helix-turn-helix domain-containing protein [Ruegeria arenilitoris]